MVNKGQQLTTKWKIERFISGSCNLHLYFIEKALANIGFIELGADPNAVAMEHRPDEL